MAATAPTTVSFLPILAKASDPGMPPNSDGHSHTHEQNDYTLALKAKDYPAFEVPIIPAVAPNERWQLGDWGPVLPWPFVMASVANLPDGRVLTWGGNNGTYFSGGTTTLATIWNPANGQMQDVSFNDHSMFCGIPTMLEDGRIFVNGGDGTRARTSIFDYRTNQWTRVQDMSVGRWYPGSVALPNGKVFTALGDPGSQYPEIWTPGQGWTVLNGANLQAPILAYGGYQSTWLPQFHLAPNGTIIHTGPTQQMNILNPAGSGSITPAGINNTWYPKYGAVVMYDEGRILVAGGQAEPNSNTATNQAMIVDVTGPTPTATTVTPMNFPRRFNSTTVLPTGEVLMIGGNTSGVEFSDEGSVLIPEIWNSDTRTWRTVAPHSIPRNYHSVALLMTDGRVFSGGGGLCGCAADHADAQVYSPPYLFNTDGSNATRPAISSAPSTASAGNQIAVQATSGMQRFTMVKMTGVTHDLNSDLRFLRVPFTTQSSGQYQLNLHGNTNVLTPGYWMLFAINSQGVPSVARVIQITTGAASSNNPPSLTNPGDQTNIVGTAINMSLSATDPDGDSVTFSSTGLPPGLTLGATTGVIAGTLTTAGTYNVSVTVQDGRGGSSTQPFTWSVGTAAPPPTGAYRYVRIEALSEVANNPWASAGEFNVLDGNGNPLGRAAWTVTADSQELVGEDGGASNAIDGNPDTIWHTKWYGSSDPMPHWFVIDLGAGFNITGLRYLPRQSGTNGRIADYRVYISADGVNWGSPVAQGRFTNVSTEQTVTFTQSSQNQPPSVAQPTNQTTAVGAAVNLQISASDADGDALTYSAVNLPPGLSINAGTGLITGAPTTVGTYNTSVTVQDARGGTASRSFTWTVNANTALSVNPLTTSPQPVNTLVSYTASANNGVNPRYKWLFGDGTPETGYSTSPNIAHTFTQPGIYVVRVTVIDDRGIEQTTTVGQAIHLPTTANRPTVSMNIAYEQRATGNGRVWVVNQDNATVSAFDAVTNAKLVEVTVGDAPRSVAVAPDGRIWVSNKRAATISIISPATLAVVQTVSLPYASQPFGIAFAPTGNAAFVVLEATGQLLRLDPATGAQTGSLTLGVNARHVSVSADGSRAYVSRFITPPIPGESTATPQVASAGGQVWVVDTGSMGVVNTVPLRHSDKNDTENSGRGIPNYLGAVAISPDGQWAWVPSKQDNILRGNLRDGRNLNFESTVRSISSRINLTTASEDYPLRVDHNNGGIASAALFDRTGSYLYVALEGSREVAVLDAYAGREVLKFDVGRAPQGLALSPDGLRLYVSNFTDRTVTVHDLSALLTTGAFTTPPLVATYNSVANEALSPQVLLGKQLFYDARDPRLARDAYISCASCHNDGGQDGRVWDMTGFGEGLRNTIALNGRAGMGQGFVHWSSNFDEIQDFEAQIRNLAGGTGLMSDAAFQAGTRSQPLGDPKAGLSADLDALAAYVNSLNAFAPSPARNSDGTLNAAAIAGREVFRAANCAQCHTGVAFTESSVATLRNIGTIKPASGLRLGAPLTGIDPPTLRDVWTNAPYLHDGSAATLEEAVNAHSGVSISPSDLPNLIAYLRQIGSLEPVAPSNNAPPAVTLTAPANGATYTAPATIALAASASDSDGTVARVEFLNGTTVLGEDTTAPYTFNWTNVPAGTYALTARAFDNAGASTTSAVANVTVSGAPTCALPSGWTSQDIGNPGRAGSACESGGTWTVNGGGADIWGFGDSFHYAYVTASGDYTITARVTSVQNTDGWAKSGVMFRDGTAANAAFAMVVQIPSNEVAFQWRPTTGGEALWTDSTVGGTAGVKWVRLSRIGTAMRAFYATTTGLPATADWVQIGSAVSIPMASPLVGLSVTAHNDAVLNTSTFTNVDVTPGGAPPPPPPPNAPPAVTLTAPANGATYTAPATIALAASASDSDGTVARVEFLNGTTVLGEDTTAPYTFNWTNVPAGTYALTARAFDNAGASTTSAVANVTVSGAPTCALPNGWTSQDIGNPGVAGSACESGGTWTVTGGGADIWGTTDQFRFTYVTAGTNYTITARVTSLQNTDPGAKAGVMIRNGTAANARFAMVVMRPNNEVAFQWRSSTNATWAGSNVGGTAEVKWVRLRKIGSSFTAFYSTASGVPAANQWVQIGASRSISMSTPRAGLAVTSRNNAVAATATFTNVTAGPQ